MHFINSAEWAHNPKWIQFFIIYGISYINSTRLMSVPHEWWEEYTISGISMCVHVCVFKCKYIYVLAGEKWALTLALLTHLWWQSEKEHERAEASTAILSAPYHPSAFCPFPGLSQKNYRITLLQSLSKHRQIPHQPWPQLWQDDLRCTATGSVRCPSEQSPSSNLHTCPGCVNDPSLFDKHVFLYGNYLED